MKKSIPITQRAKCSPLKADLSLIQGAATLGMSKIQGDATAQFRPVSMPDTMLSEAPIDEEESNTDDNNDGENNENNNDENDTNN
tara:strand:- start:170 stop:424 length:255 start_codon:yes stop_codon:yes gene_type:complete